MTCKSKLSGPKTSKFIGANEITGVWTFLATVDWTETWLQALICFHIFWLVIVLTTRKYSNFQAAIFVFLLMLVYLCEYINEWAASNFKLFSKQQYFDSSGLFISLVFSAPILFNCLIIVICWLRSAVSLLINVKRAQLKDRIKNMKEEQGQEKESQSQSADSDSTKSQPDKKND